MSCFSRLMLDAADKSGMVLVHKGLCLLLAGLHPSPRRNLLTVSVSAPLTAQLHS